MPHAPARAPGARAPRAALHRHDQHQRRRPQRPPRSRRPDRHHDVARVRRLVLAGGAGVPPLAPRRLEPARRPRPPRRAGPRRAARATGSATTPSRCSTRSASTSAELLGDFYRSDDDVRGDPELLAFARELVADDGGRVAGHARDRRRSPGVRRRRRPPAATGRLHGVGRTRRGEQRPVGPVRLHPEHARRAVHAAADVEAHDERGPPRVCAPGLPLGDRADGDGAHAVRTDADAARQLPRRVLPRIRAGGAVRRPLPIAARRHRLRHRAPQPRAARSRSGTRTSCRPMSVGRSPSDGVAPRGAGLRARRVPPPRRPAPLLRSHVARARPRRRPRPRQSRPDRTRARGDTSRGRRRYAAERRSTASSRTSISCRAGATSPW